MIPPNGAPPQGLLGKQTHIGVQYLARPKSIVSKASRLIITCTFVLKKDDSKTSF